MDILELEEDSCTRDLLPLTSIRPVIDIRIGILTLREKWERLLGPIRIVTMDGGGILPANLLPTRRLAGLIRAEWAKPGPGNRPSSDVRPLSRNLTDTLLAEARRIQYPWSIFQYNAEALAEDFALLTEGRTSQPIPESVQAITPGSIFIEEGARLSHCLLNASTGPIYIGRGAEIMEGSLIRGPFAACEGSVVKMGAKIYGATTLGPYSTAGGEIKNVVFFGYSNKGHDGYLGDSVIGEWCNLGAGSSNSNLKNNAGEVKVWHPASQTYLSAGLKCGLILGDYSRAAINTSFNTGTVAGICCNIFGAGLTPKYIPDFSWGPEGSGGYDWDKALRDISNWKKLKNQSLTDKEILALRHIFDQS